MVEGSISKLQLWLYQGVLGGGESFSSPGRVQPPSSDLVAVRPFRKGKKRVSISPASFASLLIGARAPDTRAIITYAVERRELLQ